MATLPQPKPIDRRWETAPVDPEAVARLVREAGVSKAIAHVLVSRGIDDPDEARRFLDPRLADLTPPDRMKDLDAAAERVARAMADAEPIAVFGDFDVDGVTAVSLLFLFFRELGVDVRTYIPHRLGEGYGLNESAVRLLAEEGIRLLITVDCGISDDGPIAVAQSLGMDVIVTDHHRVSHALPPAFAVVNPNRPDCEFPFKHLAGVGLAFHLAAAVRRLAVERGFVSEDRSPDLRRHLDLVALGTVADIAQLTGDNRILTRYGLGLLTEETRLGVRALKEVARIGKKPVTAGTIGFQLGPRINAAGRVGEPIMAMRLLVSDSVSEALALARTLDEANRTRQQLEQSILDDVRRRLLSADDLHGRASIVLASDSWHPGVVGIVASKIVEEFNRPTILIAMKETRGRGSARSTSAYNIHDGIRECEDLLVAFGGHRMAAGLEVERANLDAFVEAFERVTRKVLAGMDNRPVLRVDLELGLADATEELIGELALMAPFGFGNPEPVMATRAAKVVEKRVVGSRHLKLALEEGGVSREAIWFNRASASSSVPPVVDVAYQAKIDTYMGTRRVVLYVKDLHPAE